MDEKIKQEWIDALRNSEYSQHAQPGTYCTLGLLTGIFDPPGPPVVLSRRQKIAAAVSRARRRLALHIDPDLHDPDDCDY